MVVVSHRSRRKPARIGDHKQLQSILYSLPHFPSHSHFSKLTIVSYSLLLFSHLLLPSNSPHNLVLLLLRSMRIPCSDHGNRHGATQRVGPSLDVINSKRARHNKSTAKPLYARHQPHYLHLHHHD